MQHHNPIRKPGGEPAAWIVRAERLPAWVWGLVGQLLVQLAAGLLLKLLLG